MTPEFISSATEFVAFMETIWGGPCEPTEDGGVIIRQHPDYDRWHNAHFTVGLTCAKQTGNSQLGGEYASVYRWPDTSGVVITRSGGACQVSRTRFSKKKR